MKKSKRVLFFAVILAVILSCGLIMTACGNDKGHTHSLAKTEAVAATCTAAGSIAYWTCSDCDKLFSDAGGETEITLAQTAVAALGHDLAWEVSETQHWKGCVREGCDYETAKENHSGGTATCEHKAECGECEEEYGNLPEHSFTAETVAEKYLKTPAGCTTDAVYWKSCSACGAASGTETFTAADTKLGHSYTEFVHDEYEHWYECVRCDAADESTKEAHHGGTATCAKRAECEDCDTEYGDIHIMTFMPLVESTLAVAGIREHYACDCGKYYSDADALNELQEEDLALSLLQDFNVGNSNVVRLNAAGNTINTSNQGGAQAVGGNPTGTNGINSNGYGRAVFTYNLTVTENTDVLLYLNTSGRTGIKVNDVYSVRVNGQNITLGNDVMMYDAGGVVWTTQFYTLIGKVSLSAGVNNVIEVTRINLDVVHGSTTRGNYTFNYYGIGLARYNTDAAIDYTVRCAHICPHCKKCTDGESTSSLCAEKCLGHEDGHGTNVCGVCGDCTESCTLISCTSKCGCQTFNVATSPTELSSNVTLTNAAGEPIEHQKSGGTELNVSAGDTVVVRGEYRITYTIYASEATTAKLFIRTSSQSYDNSVADSYSFNVNGNPQTINPSLMMPYLEDSKWNNVPTFVAEIELDAGVNTIVITRPDVTSRLRPDLSIYNFFGLVLSPLNGAQLSSSAV